MAQFDVVRNLWRQKDEIPFMVILQSTRLDQAATRLVAPLERVRQGSHRLEDHHLTPRFEIAGVAVVMDVFNLAAVPTGRLGPVVATLSDDGSRARIIRALDELISQA